MGITRTLAANGSDGIPDSGVGAMRWQIELAFKLAFKRMKPLWD